MKAMKSALKTFWSDEDGATAIEYALIAALIAMAIAVTVAAVGTNINALFTRISNCVAKGTCS